MPFKLMSRLRSANAENRSVLPLAERRRQFVCIERLENRQMLSAAPGAVKVTQTRNESTSLLVGSPITPAPTITYTGSNLGDSTAPTPVITVLGASGSGPNTVFVHALDSILGAGTCLTARYVWDFGDAGSEYDTLVGFNAGHTYNKPGTYTITLTLTNQLGKTRSLAVSVTIAASTSRTLYVDSTIGSDNNNGLTPKTPLKTAAAADKLLTSNCQILFRAGETFPITSAISVTQSNVLIGSYGAGSNPTLLRELGKDTAIVSTLASSTNVVIQNLTFDSIWKPVGVIADKMPADGIFPGGTDTTIRNCTFLNVDVAVNENRNPQGVMVQDCLAPLPTGLRGNFLWGQGTDNVVLGNYVANSTREHDIRMDGSVRELIDNNNITNLDRSALGDTADYSKGCIDIQRGWYAYVSNNYCYDGELRVGPRFGPATTPGDVDEYVVFEGNHTFNHQIQVYPGTYHVMMRSNIMNVPSGAEIDITPKNSAGDNISDITIANNTGYTGTVGGNFIRIEVGGAAASVTLENNLWIAPNLIPGENGSAAVYIADANAKVLKLSTHNVWPMPTTFNKYAAGGVNYAYPSWLPPHGYYTPAAWNALPNVSDDLFSQTAVSANLTPLVGTIAATAAIPEPGIFVDINGKARPAGHFSAGALQT